MEVDDGQFPLQSVPEEIERPKPKVTVSCVSNDTAVAPKAKGYQVLNRCINGAYDPMDSTTQCRLAL